MKAVVLHAYGDVGQLHYEEVPQPVPAADEVLVKVAATSVNPVDRKLRSGILKNFMPVAFPAILGNDVAGEVAATGARASGFQVGDRVMGLTSRSYAEFLTEKAASLAHIPDGLDIGQAGVLPVVALTGAQLIERGVQPKPGETVLVTGALGGVGRTAVYAARRLGARVVAGVRASQKSAAASLGADRVVALDDPADLASLGPLDAIADTVGGDVIAALVPKLKPSGLIASVVGPPATPGRPDVRISQIVVQADAARLRQLAEDVLAGKLAIPIAARFKLSDIREAHRLAAQGGIGKIVLVP